MEEYVTIEKKDENHNKMYENFSKPTKIQNNEPTVGD